MLKKVLIANRGEIAVRIIRACKELGIQTVAVYSQADKQALHVLLADESICIGSALASQSYLNKTAILSAAIALGADAIHPGFGFLSENAEFVLMCQEHGIQFIGPSAETIDLMGDKANARQSMQAIGVPVTSGSQHVLTTVEEAVLCAEALGYPVLLKAVSGGGGKGMRKVFSSSEIKHAFTTAQAEAKAAFFDDRIYMEKFIFPARHIEIQILADKYGHVIHLGERECSLQRQHQKVIEESPSPFLDDTLRKQMGEIAVKAAKAVNYEGAGTIEFLVDQSGQFFFMEMNTRIQVEHPVTEMVTGIDLVKWQLRIAGGEALTVQQEAVHLKGHSIECRINAEDPYHDFLASSGHISFAFLPSGTNGLRVESAIYNGYTLPPFYDSMIAKVIVHDTTRQAAILKMKRALSEVTIEGIKTNVALQEALLSDEQFVKGQFDTDYLQREFLVKWKEANRLND